MKAALSTGSFLNGLFGKSFMKNLTSGLKRIIPATPIGRINKKAAKVSKAINAIGNEQVLYFPVVYHGSWVAILRRS
jgi:hypothetical protein